MTPCPLCGDPIDTTGKYCQKCYSYLKVHPEGLYELPPSGAVYYAPNGDPICHICGKAIRKLGNHIAFAHHMSQNEYRERFNLYHNTRLSNAAYQKKMADYNKQYESVVVKQNLLVGGANTRVGKVWVAGRKKQHKIQSKVVENNKNV